jgi:hypothetical protein
MIYRSILLLLFLFWGSYTSAKTITWDRVENIRESAAQVRRIEKSQGLSGALSDARKCYDRELKKEYGLTQELESCMIQDYIVAQSSAAILSQMSPEARRKANLPEPGALIDEMSGRIKRGFARLGIPENEMSDFISSLKKNAMQAYIETRYTEGTARKTSLEASQISLPQELDTVSPNSAPSLPLGGKRTLENLELDLLGHDLRIVHQE